MAYLAIRAEGLGKRYSIGKRQANYCTLRERMAQMAYASWYGAKRLLSGNRKTSSESEETIWALKGVSIDIYRGEVVGIIGPNGAGKSTLLKILSKITEPTEGWAEISGRIGSLLEVGTAFHPELTGRENVFLNGAVLGMKRAEIKCKFDEIVAFAEVEKFIDTPVKHYSSGMYLRLAFAVAAHLEPEILIVDEVLAVGDAAFQKKCLGKMAGVAQGGRTVLFVSHDMSAITRLCGRAILLDEGRLLRDGTSHEVVRTYLNSGLKPTAVREWSDPSRAPRGEIARLRAVRIRREDGQCTETIDIRNSIALEMEYQVFRPGYKFMPSFHLHNEESVHIFSLHDQDLIWRRRERPVGRYCSRAYIPGNFLCEGTFYVTSGLITIEPFIIQFHEKQIVSFQIVDIFDGNSARGDWAGPMYGVVRPLLKWSTDFYPDDRQIRIAG